MKFKEIKPGMVIHCPKEEDARALFEHLGKDPNEIHYGVYDEETCYRLYGDMEISCGSTDYFKCFDITEFSDLIELDEEINKNDCGTIGGWTIHSDSPVSAVEVLEWLKYAGKGALVNLFGTVSCDEILLNNTPQEIVDKITAYETVKKAPKPVEVEEGYFCELYEKIDLSDIAVLGYNMWGVDKNVATKDVQEKARKYASEMKKACYAKVTYKCRVKEGE